MQCGEGCRLRPQKIERRMVCEGYGEREEKKRNWHVEGSVIKGMEKRQPEIDKWMRA